MLTPLKNQKTFNYLQFPICKSITFVKHVLQIQKMYLNVNFFLLLNYY